MVLEQANLNNNLRFWISGNFSLIVAAKTPDVIFQFFAKKATVNCMRAELKKRATKSFFEP